MDYLFQTVTKHHNQILLVLPDYNVHHNASTAEIQLILKTNEK